MRSESRRAGLLGLRETIAILLVLVGLTIAATAGPFVFGIGELVVALDARVEGGRWRR